MKPNFSRKNYFIKKDFQGKFVLSYFLFVIFGSIIFVGILSLFSADSLTIVYENHDLQLGKTSAVLLKNILSAQWAFIVFGGLLVVIASILLTHRVAGPIYRFEKALDEMQKGNFNVSTTLRDKDEGHELAGKINEFNLALSAKLENMISLNRALDNEFAALCEELKQTAKNDKASETLQRVEIINRQMKDILDTFSLKNQ